MKKNIITTVLLSLLIMVIPGCSLGSSDVMDTVRKSGVIRVAILQDNAPYSFIENEEYKGIEVDIAKNIVEQTGLSISFVPSDSQENLITLIQSGEADIAIGNLVNTESLQSKAETSTTYMTSSVYVVTPRGVFSSTKGAFQNSVIGMSTKVSDTTSIALYGITGATVNEYSAIDTVEADLIGQTIKGYFCYETEALMLMKSEFLQAQSVTNIDQESFVVITQKGSVKMSAGIDLMLQNMITDGSLDEIFAAYITE